MHHALYRSLQLTSGRKRTREQQHLFEEAIPVKQKTGGWLTGIALSETGVETLFDTREKYDLVTAIARAFGFDESARFYLPGIGMSDAGRYMRDQGYGDVIVGDVGDKSLQYQCEQLEIGAEHCVRSDILTDALDPPADVVVDSSVLDVFLASPGLPIARAIDGMKKQMNENGVFICFSMNNQTLFRQLRGKFKHTWYTFVRMRAPQSVRGRANNIVTRADVSLWVCTDRNSPPDTTSIMMLTQRHAPYMSAFRYAPTLSDIRNEDLSTSRFFNMSNPKV